MPAAFLLAASIAASPSAAQVASGSAAGAAPTDIPAGSAQGGPLSQPVITQSDLNRIRHALSIDSPLRIDDEQLRFYVEVLARTPTFAEFVKGYDLRHGPTKRGNPMTHQEFLDLVTPRELYSSSGGGITATDLLQFAVTNWLGQTLVRRALEEMREAKSDEEVKAIRDRINRELAALNAGGN
jgi:hypothetical protein